MLHSGLRALLASLLLLLPAAARAQLSIEALDLDVLVSGTNGQDTLFQVTITLTGTDIGSATITREGSSAINLPCSSTTSCSATQNLANQAALDALLPTATTNYTIALAQGTSTVTDTFPFARPAVPSPAISEPANGSTIDPGMIEVRFATCATCTRSEGTLMQGATLIEEKLDLAPASTSWTPVAELAASSAFSAEIVHVALGSASPTADGPGAGTDDDPYSFTSDVRHGDTVEFSTGFAPPTGDFCIILLDTLLPGPGTDCAVLDDPALGILGTSGSFATTLAGIAIEYETTLGPKGAVTGTAMADLDGDASLETSAPLKGRLRGKNGALRQRLRARFVNDALEAKLRLRILEDANLASLSSSSELTTLLSEELRGKQGGAKVDATSSSTPVIVAPPIGWRLDFHLGGSENDITGQLQAAGSTVTLLGTQSFDNEKNQSDIRLSSGGAERGIQLRIRKLAVDAATITSGEFKFRAFGQSGSGLLP